MKKVLLIVVDALASRVVRPAMNAGRLPHFAALAQAGCCFDKCLSIFPSITPAATSAIATGCYPRDHRISGAYWYDGERDEVAYFGSDVWPILREGVGDFLRDFQIKLNCERLQASTIFEEIENNSDLSDAVINYMWFRGTHLHEVTTPWVVKLLSGASMEPTMPGPQVMCLADFVQPVTSDGQRLQARGGMGRRYGFHDEATSDYLLGLARADGLPDFTLAYFPNNDFESHEHGPLKAETILEAVDACLGQLIELSGGLHQFLNETAILITGDHAQSDMLRPEAARIDLSQVLDDLKVVKAGSAWESDDDVMACPNLRAAQIYFRSGSWRDRQLAIDSLIRCPSVDQVILTQESTDSGPPDSYRVLTADRGELRFRYVDSEADVDDEEDHAVDDYGATWAWRGNLATVDAEVDDGQLVWGDYPNAFERIALSFCHESGTLWATARLGCEFALPGTHVNPGGSHGSLHMLDSAAPLIAAGIPDFLELPQNPRIVDVAPICLQILGIETALQAGQSHMTGRTSGHQQERQLRQKPVRQA